MSSSCLQPTNKNAQTDASYFLLSLRVFFSQCGSMKGPCDFGTCLQGPPPGWWFRGRFSDVASNRGSCISFKQAFWGISTKKTGILWDEHIGEDVFSIIRCVPHPYNKLNFGISSTSRRCHIWRSSTCDACSLDAFGLWIRFIARQLLAPIPFSSAQTSLFSFPSAQTNETR